LKRRILVCPKKKWRRGKGEMIVVSTFRRGITFDKHESETQISKFVNNEVDSHIIHKMHLSTQICVFRVHGCDASFVGIAKIKVLGGNEEDAHEM
jgi:hypothetical protein